MLGMHVPPAVHAAGFGQSAARPTVHVKTVWSQQLPVDWALAAAASERMVRMHEISLNMGFSARAAGEWAG
jgi:hypothetical protein